MQQEKYGFVYIWYDRKHKRYYIGSHWGTKDDGYICSSRRMRQAYRRRPQDFKRRIIDVVYEDRVKLYESENRWLKLAEKNKDRYYNILFTTQHWAAYPENVKTISEKISHKTKEAMQRPEVRKKYEEGLKNRDNKSSDLEVREKRRQSMIKTMAKKFPIEDRIHRTVRGSVEHTTKLKEAAAKRHNITQEQLDTINKKTKETKLANGTLFRGTEACKKANVGSKRLWKEGSYKKALPGSEKWNDLVNTGWSIKKDNRCN